MDFNKINVFSSINADEVEIGTMGYYGDDFDSLRKCVNKWQKILWYSLKNKTWHAGT